MERIKLTRRNYIGEGYWHYFTDDITGEEIREECTKRQYERMGQKGGSKFNPTKRGYTWTHSVGGCINVDTPTKELGINEYVDLSDGKSLMRAENGKHYAVPTTEIVNDEIEIIWQ